MLKTFYVQTTTHGKVTDIIEYPYEDYVETQLETPLPVGVLGGTYQLMDGQLIYRPEWDIEMTTLRDDVDYLLMIQLEEEGLI